MKKLFLFGAVAATVLTSCGEKDYYDPEVAKEIKDAERLSTYAASFKSVFGTIPADFCWDFTQNSMMASRADDATLIDGVDFGGLIYNSFNKTSTVGKNQNLFNAIFTALPEGKKNDGKVAVLTAPANQFTIYPLICQGEWTHDLYVKVDGQKEVLVYSKTWNDFAHPYVNGKNESKYDSSKNITTTMQGVTINTKAGNTIEIYIKNVKKGDDKIYDTNFAVGTGTGSAILVDTKLTPADLVDFPTDIVKKDSKLQFVGIEDDYDMKNHKVKGDFDYNDIVLLMVGNPDVPGEHEIIDNEYEVDITKRYMVEDLGALAASDIDFNDIVIDMVSHDTHHVTLVDGVITEDKVIKKEQTATIRALGGTLDIALQFKGDAEGTYRWRKSADPAYAVGTMYNTGWQGATIDYDAKLWTVKLTDSPWDADTNNVVVWVWPTGASQIESDYSDYDKYGQKDPYQIVFPQNGEVPCMVAFYPSKQWRLERDGITKVESESGTEYYWWKNK